MELDFSVILSTLLEEGKITRDQASKAQVFFTEHWIIYARKIIAYSKKNTLSAEIKDFWKDKKNINLKTGKIFFCLHNLEKNVQ